MDVMVMEPLPVPDEDVDEQIRRAAEELAMLRKQRALLDLQNQLAEEQRLFVTAQDRALSASHTHHPVHSVHPENTQFLGPYPVVPYPAGRTSKRSDSEPTPGDNAILPSAEHTPMLPVTKEYRGANRKEFLLLMRRLEAHFEEWNQFYVTDYLKISEAHRHLSNEIRLKWALVRVSPERNKTWSDFCVWLSSNVRNFVHPDVAERRYRTARQRRYEPVARFARLLNSLEVNLPRLVSDDERCQRLWEGVLPEIRAASRQGYPTSFHAGLSDLCSVAKLIPGGGGDRYRPGRRRRRRGRRRFL